MQDAEAHDSQTVPQNFGDLVQPNGRFRHCTRRWPDSEKRYENPGREICVRKGVDKSDRLVGELRLFCPGDRIRFMDQKHARCACFQSLQLYFTPSSRSTSAFDVCRSSIARSAGVEPFMSRLLISKPCLPRRTPPLLAHQARDMERPQEQTSQLDNHV